MKADVIPATCVRQLLNSLYGVLPLDPSSWVQLRADEF